MEVIFLAGGKGSRLQPVVSDRPKPMADISGSPFLEYLLAFWKQQGCDHYVLSIGYMEQVIRNHFGDSYQGVPISYISEKQPLGTGGALLKAKMLIDSGNFVLVNGDSYLDFSFASLLEQHIGNQAAFTMALFEAENSNRYGTVILDHQNNIIKLLEKSPDVSHGWINAGIYLINSEMLENYEDENKFISFEQELIPDWLNQHGKLQGYKSNGFFIDIGIPDDYQKAQKLIPDLINVKQVN